jgi:hypothetical protein
MEGRLSLVNNVEPTVSTMAFGVIVSAAYIATTWLSLHTRTATHVATTLHTVRDQFHSRVNDMVKKHYLLFN